MAALCSLSGLQKLFYDINVEGTKSALNAALQAGTSKVVYTSSVAAVGMIKDPFKVLDENADFNMWNMGPYIRTKRLGEQTALEFAKHGLPVVIVNPATVIGIYDIKPTPSGQIILDFLNKKTPGYTEGGGNYVDVEDVARGHILAAKNGRIGERYILGNASLTLKDFFTLVSEISGIRVPTRKYSRQTVLGLGYLMRFLSLFTGKTPVVTPTSARVASSYFYFNCSKAVNELGFPQTPLKTSIAKAVNWFKEKGNLKTLKGY
jgi:dihydroflavonol-4-reductase